MKVKIFVSAILMASMFCACGNDAGNVKAATETQSSVQSEKNNNKVAFSDVHSGDWYYDTVTEMAQRGIYRGTAMEVSSQMQVLQQLNLRQL